jgi:hypothetical protein
VCTCQALGGLHAQLTPELIRSSKIGSTIAEVKRKYALAIAQQPNETASKVTEQSKILLVQFKRIIESAGAGVAKPTTAAAAEPAVVVQPRKPVSYDSTISEHRQKIADLLTDALSAKSDEDNKTHYSSDKIRSVAQDVEAAINQVHPYDGNTKQYSSKARTLVFNIKKNAVNSNQN